MIVATAQRTKSILLPQYGFQGSRDLQPVPAHHADRFDAGYLLLVSDTRGRAEHYELRDATTPRPADAYNVLVLTGGHQRYYRSVNHTNGHAPWWYRLANGERDCYVVWGRSGREGIKIFNPTSTARTSSGRGAIYTRWPVFDNGGQLTHYGWEVRQVEFNVLDRQPALGDKLRLTVSRMRGVTDPGQGESHELYQMGLDDLWRQLVTKAKAGFDAHCSAQLDTDTEQWRVWFLNQRAQARADRDSYNGFHARMKLSGGPGWLAALDSAEEAWQLELALSAYSSLFPQVAPNVDLLSDPNMDDRWVIRDPGYGGSSGDMEARLLAAYLEFRPERHTQLMAWMDTYVQLASRARNYTGD